MSSNVKQRENRLGDPILKLHFILILNRSIYTGGPFKRSSKSNMKRFCEDFLKSNFPNVLCLSSYWSVNSPATVVQHIMLVIEGSKTNPINKDNTPAYRPQHFFPLAKLVFKTNFKILKIYFKKVDF